MQKEIVEAKQSAVKDATKMQDLLDLVTAIDEHLPWRVFFKQDGIEMLAILFKLTFFGHKIDKDLEESDEDLDEIKPRKKLDSEEIAYSVCNLENCHELGKTGNYLDPETIMPEIVGANAEKSKVNFIANKLILKLLNCYEDKMQLLIAGAELLYLTGSEARSTKRLAKTLVIFAEMARLMQESGEGIMSKHDRSKMFQGTLFQINGLLNSEAKSYLITKEEGGFVPVAPIINVENPIDAAQQKHVRKLSEGDLKYFETEFCYVVTFFIRGVTAKLSGLDAEKMKTLLHLTYEDSYDDMKKMEKEEPELLDQVLSAHFATRFLLDFLQFSFSHLVIAKT
jgi:hypothetical protein